MITRERGRVAAWAAAGILAVVASYLFYAVLHAAVGADPPPASALVAATMAGLLAIGSAAVLLSRAGYLNALVPLSVGRRWAPWVAYASVGGAVAGFAGQLDAPWYVAGPINLVISLLAIAVARSELPEAESSGRHVGTAAR